MLEFDAEMTTVFLLFAGLVAGFCSSAPLGPINLWLVEAIIGDSKRSVISFLSGVIIVDLVFAYVAVWGYFEYLKDSTYVDIAQVGAGIFLLAIGVANFFKLFLRRHKKDQESHTPHGIASPVKNFLMGLTLCGSNPGFLMFWLFVVNFLNKSANLEMTILANTLFLLGVALGDSLWFGLLAKLVSKGLNLAKPSILLSIRYGISFSFLAFGVATIWQAL